MSKPAKFIGANYSRGGTGLGVGRLPGKSAAIYLYRVSGNVFTPLAKFTTRKRAQVALDTLAWLTGYGDGGAL